MRRGAAIVAFALLAATPAAQAQSSWERLRDSARSWLGLAEDPAAALARLGGTRLLLAPDFDDFRNTVLVELRDDVRKLTREARVPYANLAVRDGGVEVRLRDPSLVPAALTALAATAGPAHDAVDILEAGDGVVRLVPAERAIAERLNGPLDKAVDVIRLRLDGLGPAAAGVRRDGPDRILVIAPGIGDPARVVQPIQQTARLEFRLIDISMPASAALQSRAPEASEVLYEFKTRAPFLVYKQSTVGGRDIADARAGFDQNGRPAVNFQFTARGAREFGRLTQENIDRPFAIVLDNVVLSAPIIRTPILGGNGQITGTFTADEAWRLAVQLRAGALPVKLIVVEQTTVPPAAKN
jgi:preprotein translocase subunit SecD